MAAECPFFEVVAKKWKDGKMERETILRVLPVAAESFVFQLVAEKDEKMER